MVTLVAALGAALVARAPARPVTFLDVLLLMFSVVRGISVLVGDDTSYGLARVNVFVNWLLLYYLCTKVVTSGVRLFFLVGTWLLCNLKMSQFGARSLVARGFTFVDWGATGAPVWFHNSGEFAIQMCVFLGVALPLVIALGRNWPTWKMSLVVALVPGTAFLSLVASSSRGGQLGGAAVLGLMLLRSRRRVQGLIAVALILPALWFVTPPEQKARFESMGDDPTSVSRLTYWADGIEIMNQHPVSGIGYENWLPYYRRYYNPSGELPHNIFVQAGAELGYPGLILFILLIGATFVANAKSRRVLSGADPSFALFGVSLAWGLDPALVGYLVSGFFVTVLYYPYFWMNLSFTAALYLIAGRERAGRVGRSGPIVIQRHEMV